jgi:hypothetical protein
LERVVSDCNIDYFNFLVNGKSEILKFRISLNATKILPSTFESTENESKSQQNTLKMNEIKVLFIGLIQNFEILTWQW